MQSTHQNLPSLPAQDPARPPNKDARQEIANRVDGKPTEHVQVEQNVTFNVGDTTGLETRLDGVLSRRTSDPLREKPPH